MKSEEIFVVKNARGTITIHLYDSQLIHNCHLYGGLRKNQPHRRHLQSPSDPVSQFSLHVIPSIWIQDLRIVALGNRGSRKSHFILSSFPAGNRVYIMNQNRGILEFDL